MGGAFWLILLVVALTPFADGPPPQVWGPFSDLDTCVRALTALVAESLQDGDWSVEEAMCAPGPTPSRELEILWPKE